MRVWRTIATTFLVDEMGNFSMMAAIAALPIMIGVAALSTYSNTVTVKGETQAAADAAALAATTAFATNKVSTTTDARAVATQYFAANAPQQAIAGQTSFNVTVTPPPPGSSAVTTTVNYCGALPGIVSSLVGSSSQVCASATSTADVVAAQSGAGAYTGSGVSWGDPHMIGEDGSDFTYACSIGSWTNVLSDYGLQINGLCEPFNAAYVFSDVAIVAGGHYIYINSGYLPASNDGDFEGVLTVDGVTTSPQSAGTYTLLNDTTQNIVLTDVYGAPGVADSYANYVTLTTPEYSITIQYGNGTQATITAATNNAGACGVPGGVLGQTWGASSAIDQNGLDFTVPGGSNYWYLAPQYSTACANSAANTMTQHATLTK